MRDMLAQLHIEIPDDAPNDIYNQISYKLNQACTEIEGLKCHVFYKLKDSNNNVIHLMEYGA